MEKTKSFNRQVSFNEIMDDVANEVSSAVKNHGYYNSAHEAYGVMCEEVREFFDEVCKKRSLRDLKNMRKELVQVAAVAVKTILSLELR